MIAGEGPDRGRLEELAGDHRLDGRVVFTGRLDDDALADQYAKCLAVFYAPIDEDMGYVPFEAFLAEKPVVTTRDAGGPLEVVEDRRTGLVCEPTPGAVAEALAWLRAHPDEARAQGQAGKGVAAQLTWDATIDRLLGMRVAYYSPLPPDRSGIADYSAHLLPALEHRVEVKVAKQHRRPPRGCDVALYHVGNNPDAHGWIVEALRKRPGIVVLHDVVLHHLVAGMTVARDRPDGYLDAMQRESGVVGRLLAHGVVDGLLQPLWEDRAGRLSADDVGRRAPRPGSSSTRGSRSTGCASSASPAPSGGSRCLRGRSRPRRSRRGARTSSSAASGT